MKKKNQSKQSSNSKSEPKKSTGRKCSVCTHKDAKKINSLVQEGASFRRISSQFGMSDKSVGRHVENCLKLEVRALIKENLIEQAFDFHNKLESAVLRAEKLVESSSVWLTDPNDESGFDLSPRVDELNVIYYDFNDLNSFGNPTRKKALLSDLLQIVKGAGLDAVKVDVLTVDNRKLHLDAIKKFLDGMKVLGDYLGVFKKPQENTDELTQLKKHIQRVAEAQGTDYQTELKIFLENYADRVKPELKSQLVNELNH